jgi:hypothetical protein
MTTQKLQQTNDKAEIHWRIRELAVSARTSVSGLLREARISPATVHQWKTGQCQPRANTIQRLNEAAERLRERNA